MSTTTTKTPKHPVSEAPDFSQWTKAEETKPRTLREIADEVGFPFAAKAVLPTIRRRDDDVEPIPVGGVVTITGPSEYRLGSFDSSEYDDRWPEPLAIRGDIPRWILLGDRT